MGCVKKSVAQLERAWMGAFVVRKLKASRPERARAPSRRRLAGAADGVFSKRAPSAPPLSWPGTVPF